MVQVAATCLVCLCRLMVRGWLLRTVPIARAGPPFVTDDPEPTPRHQFALCLATRTTHIREGSETTWPGLELDYGAATDLELSMAGAEDHRAPRGMLHSIGNADPAILGRNTASCMRMPAAGDRRWL